MRYFRQIPLVILIVLVVHILFAITYSASSYSDGETYLNMLIKGKSNLINASGYPFLIGLAFRNYLGQLLLEHHSFVFLFILILFQHLLFVAALYLFYKVVSMTFGYLAANLSCIIYGLNWGVVGYVSNTRPEWFQGALLVLILGSAFYAYRNDNLLRKTILYSISFTAFIWSFLVKYNSAPLIVLFIIMFFIEKIYYKQRVVIFTIAVSIGLINLFGFIYFYHYPSTGTYTLNYDRSWVLLNKVGDIVPDGHLSAYAGINTKRLMLLNTLLPWDGKGVYAIPRIDFVTDVERAPYKQYHYILNADDTALDHLLSEISIRKDWDYYTAFSPVAYYIGLEESNEIGAKVFYETIKTYPWNFLRNVYKSTLDSLTQPLDMFSFPIDMDKFRVVTIYKYGLSKIDSSNWNLRNPFGYLIWGPGIRIFSVLSHIKIPFSNAWLLFILLGQIIMISNYFKSRIVKMQLMIYSLLLLFIILFITYSNLIYYFRFKELMFIFPIICVLLGVSFSLFYYFIRNIFHSHTI